MDREIITALITLFIGAITAYFTWELGKRQVAQLDKSSKDTDSSTREIEFREDLLTLISQQEDKLRVQDTKIDKLEGQVDTLRTLADEFRRANLNLVIENQRMKLRIEDLEKGA